MSDKAILEGRKVIPIEDTIEWALWFENARDETIVAQTVLNRRRKIVVSTVFLGLDHSFGGRPVWFETMVFGTSIDGAQARYSDWDSAERGHAKMIARARAARQLPFERPNLKKARRSLRHWRRSLSWR